MDQTKASDEALAQRIIGFAMKVHRVLGYGFVESIYAKALLVELEKAGVEHERERVFPLGYKRREVGVFQADLVIENRSIVELKSIKALAVAHSVQLVNYLAAAKVNLGLLLNLEQRACNSVPRQDFTTPAKRRT